MKILEKIKNKLIQECKGGVFDQISGLMIGIAGLAIVSIVVFLLLANLGANTQVVADGNATAAVNTITNAAADIPAWTPIVVIVAIGILIFGLVKAFQRN